MSFGLTLGSTESLYSLLSAKARSRITRRWSRRAAQQAAGTLEAFRCAARGSASDR